MLKCEITRVFFGRPALRSCASIDCFLFCKFGPRENDTEQQIIRCVEIGAGKRTLRHRAHFQRAITIVVVAICWYRIFVALLINANACR